MTLRFPILALGLAALSGCGPSYSPDTYASNAAQQANKVEQGVVVGVRNVAVSASGTVGTVTGAAAGGIAGAQVGVGATSAFSSLGGALVGGVGGAAVEHMTADTTAFEYIVRKPNGDLISVTQRDKTPLVLGQKVLVIAGTQARIVPDYTVPPPAPPAKPPEPPKPDATAQAPKPADAKPVDNQPAPPLPAVMPDTAKPIANALDGATPTAPPPTVVTPPPTTPPPATTPDKPATP